MFTAYMRSRSGNITLSEMTCKRRDLEDTASTMSKKRGVARVSVAAYGRIILSFKDGARIDSDAP
jgi:hypothetical protein